MSILGALNPYLTVIKGATIVVVLAAVSGFSAYEMHKHDAIAYDKLKTEYITFKIGVATLGEAAKKQNAIIALNNLKAKERADDENKRTHTADINTILRLRRDADNARGSFVPATPARSGRPDLACFDRAALESAIRGFVGEVRGQSDQGTAATIDLNTAKVWAQTRSK